MRRPRWRATWPPASKRLRQRVTEGDGPLFVVIEDRPVAARTAMGPAHYSLALAPDEPLPGLAATPKRVYVFRHVAGEPFEPTETLLQE